MDHRIVLALTAGIWIVLVGVPERPAHAQAGDELQSLRDDIEALQAGQKAMREELTAIRSLLAQSMRPRRRPAATEDVDLVLRGADDDPIKGNGDAELMLVEYSDYQCPFCRRHFMDTMPQLDREYVESGKVRYVFRDFPLASLHPDAAKAAEAANCAGDQGKYWEMHDRLFQNAGELEPEQLPNHGEAVGVDVTLFTECLESGKHTDEVSQDMADGRAAGISGTPSFFLAVEGDEPGTIKAFKMIRGAQPYAAFKQAIDEALEKLAKGAESG